MGYPEGAALLRRAKTSGCKSMKLSFPNESRSFDATRNRVRFWGYDGAIEITFFVEADALNKLGQLSAEMSGVEARFLKMFDAAREQIYRVAEKVYARSRDGSNAYILASADF